MPIFILILVQIILLILKQLNIIDMVWADIFIPTIAILVMCIILIVTILITEVINWGNKKG
jgi:hypothetical protein